MRCERTASVAVARQTEGPLLGDEQQRDLVGLCSELALAVTPVEQPGELAEPGPPGYVGERQCVELGGPGTPLRIGRVVDRQRCVVDDRLERLQFPKHRLPEIGRVLQPTVTMQPAPDRRPLLPLALEMHPMAIEQAAHAVMVGVDPFGTALDVLAVGEG